MDSVRYGIDFNAIQEAPERLDKPIRRTYPAFIEDKTFLPTVSFSAKTRILDTDNYSELALRDDIDDRDRSNGDFVDDSERWHVCHKCNKVFGTAKELRRHLPRHKVSKKVYECEICYRTFTQSNHLKQHMPVHSGKSRHRCWLNTQSTLQWSRYAFDVGCTFWTIIFYIPPLGWFIQSKFPGLHCEHFWLHEHWQAVS